MKKSANPRVAIGADVASDQALAERAQVVGTMAVVTALYTSNAAFKAVIDDFVASGAALAAAQAKVTNLEAQLAQARGDRDQQRVVALDAHGAAVKGVERHSTTVAAIQSYGFAQLEIVKEGAVVPTGILAEYDPKKKVINVHVKFPPGKRQHRCAVEISTDPVGPATWHRLDGDGVKRALTGYAPGTYWIHAATSVAAGRSDWFGPVSVIVT
jgi:hypothetical protein